MESLLRWSIENSTPLDNAPTNQPLPRRDIDPAIIDHILGKPDSELMKEALAVAVDESRAEDERVEALDNFEMLIEQIDNANNLDKLKMWSTLQALLTSPTSSTDIKLQTLWVIGTSLQNNPAAQNAYLSYNPLPELVPFATPSSSTSAPVRSKTLYALSGLLKHNVPALKTFGSEEVDGWSALKSALEDSDITVRRKAIFLLNSLLIPSAPSASSSHPSTASPNVHTSTDAPAPIYANSHASMLQDPSSTCTSSLTLSALQNHGIVESVIKSIVNPVPWGADGEEGVGEGDADFEEKAVQLLHTYAVTCGGTLSAKEKNELKAWLEARKGHENHWGLTVEELAALKSRLE